MRFGNVALVGRTNVGKSTFLNQVLGEPLAITSPLPQTTRDALLGIAEVDGAQIAFLDTPGIHRPRTELGRRMNAAAWDSVRSADAIILVTDAWQNEPAKTVENAWTGERKPLDSEWIRPGDKEMLLDLARVNCPVVLMINKADAVKQKELLLPMLEAYAKAFDFAGIVPTSARKSVGLDAVLKATVKLLPEGPAGYDSDTITNRPVLFFVREYIREAVLNQLRKEVPHAIAVSIDNAEETAKLLKLSATIHVEKLGQRKIIVGKGGAQIKALGIAARERIEAMVEKQVHLRLFVRITPEWKDMPRQLAELGYDPGMATENTGVEPGAKK